MHLQMSLRENQILLLKKKGNPQNKPKSVMFNKLLGDGVRGRSHAANKEKHCSQTLKTPPGNRTKQLLRRQRSTAFQQRKGATSRKKKTKTPPTNRFYNSTTAGGESPLKAQNDILETKPWTLKRVCFKQTKTFLFFF